MSLNTNIKHLRSVVMLTVLLVFGGSLWASSRAYTGEWAGTGDIYNTNTGNVGIGTSTPTAKLQVNGTVVVGLYSQLFESGAAFILKETSGQPIRMQSNSGVSFEDNSGAQFLSFTPTGGFVFPYHEISLAGDGYPGGVTGFKLFQDSGVSNRYLTLRHGNGGNEAGLKIFQVNDMANSAYAVLASTASGADITSTKTGTGTTTPIRFLIDSTEAMRVSTAGNVGIGTSSPSSKLSVVGNVVVTGDVTATGSINAKYQDVAEWVPSSQTLSSGTVVILDSSKRNNVIASSKSYDTRVAGVVSERPGVLLGEGGAGKAIIATTGRVMVKVDATHKAIAAGDLLVTSDLSGYAMASEPVNLGGVEIHRPGTLIGKALEPLAKGKKGEILVLLSLQ